MIKTATITLLISLSITLLVSVFTTHKAISYSATPPKGHTGAPGDKGLTCANKSCHAVTAKPVNGWITTTIPDSGYKPNSTYSISVTAHEQDRQTFGFQLSAQSQQGELQGEFILNKSVKLSGKGKYISHHSESNSGIESKTWTFDWIAPNTGTVEVTFYGAFNAANGDNTPDGDNIYTDILKVYEQGTKQADSNRIAAVTLAANPEAIGIDASEKKEFKPEPLEAVENLQGQTIFQKTFGGIYYDRGVSGIATIDGGYAVLSLITGGNAGSVDYSLFKTDSKANLLWHKTYGGSGYDNPTQLKQLPGGNFILVGNSNSFGAGDYDMYAILVNQLGELIWSKTYGGKGREYIHNVIQTNDNGFLFVGKSFGYGAGGGDSYLIKTDEKGDTLWTKYYGNSLYERAADVIQCTDGSYTITGFTYSDGKGIDDAYLANLDSTGKIKWAMAYGGSENEHGYTVTQTNDGGYFITGSTKTYSRNKDWNVYLIRTDSEGKLMWSKAYGGPKDDLVYYGIQTPDGGFAVAGYTESYGKGGKDVLAMKINAQGKLLWAKAYGGVAEDEALSIASSDNGGLLIVGRTESFGSGSSDIYTIKTNAEGISGSHEVTCRFKKSKTSTETTLFNMSAGSGAIVGTPQTVITILK
ncbi:MAG: hypothetical protein COA57_10660 [Flavobacteriales bacterium]|nr:hypothetical protein [Bacteroidales bacterium AH-315-I05]PCJ83708.1 MAG: hypothetical protein COA57_10660 [Flavobacteriales bacterium]